MSADCTTTRDRNRRVSSSSDTCLSARIYIIYHSQTQWFPHGSAWTHLRSNAPDRTIESNRVEWQVGPMSSLRIMCVHCLKLPRQPVAIHHSCVVETFGPKRPTSMLFTRRLYLYPEHNYMIEDTHNIVIVACQT